MVVFFMDANGNYTVIPPDPRYRQVHEIWSTHLPKEVRRGAHVCEVCGEAWPCTLYTWADDENYRLMQEDDPDGTGDYMQVRGG